MRRLTVSIPEEAADRLNQLARTERRDPRDQAAILIERALDAERAEAEIVARSTKHALAAPERER